MSGTAEAIRPPHRADLRNVSPLPETCFNPFLAATESVFRGTEINLLLGQLSMEGASTGMQFSRFQRMGHSPDPEEVRIFNGEGLSRAHPKKVVIANGFSPPPELMLEAIEEYVLEPYTQVLKNVPSKAVANYRLMREMQINALQSMTGVKSNDFLLPFGKWVNRLGHDVMFGYDEPNELQTETFFNLVDTIEFMAGNGEVTGIGLSAGGMFQELAADYLLQKYGRPVISTVVKGGSPEISNTNIEEFGTAAQRPTGVMGLVHGLAKKRMSQDPMRSKKYDGLSLLEEIMTDYAQKGPDPRITIISYHTSTDSTVPQPKSGNSIEVGGTHMGILYQPKLLDHLGRALAEPPRSRPTLLAA